MSVATKDMTPDEQYAAVVENVRRLGFQVPAKGAWQKRIGAMRDSPHFDEALRLGAEWRTEENRNSLEKLAAEA